MRPTTLEADFAGVRHMFDIGPHKALRMIEEKTGSVAAALIRLQAGIWKVDDYRETILWGLVGGGMTNADALKLVTRWVDDEPAQPNVLLATAIILSFVHGAPKDDGLGKAMATMTSGAAAPDVSTSSPSTVPVQQ